ncbi:MAG TPA: hypothetical protein VI588_02605, partial [Candidatus Gracilibacteria bacterium]|nr:hypothetical protein [Candidatus Gracilibacteria bacterium]
MAKPASSTKSSFRRRLAVLSATFCLVAGLFTDSTALFALEGEEEAAADVQALQTVTSSGESQETSFAIGETQQVIDEKALRRIEFLQNIRDALKATQKDLYDVNINVRDADGRLEETQVQITTLKEQLSNLDVQIKTAEDLILNVSIQIAEKENELVLLYEDIGIRKAAIENQKKMIAEYLKAIYEQESSVTDTMSGNEEINIAKLLLSDDSVGEQLQEIKYFNVLEQTGHEIFARLETLMTELELEQIDLEVKKSKLAALYERLSEERHNLEVQKNAKKQLLEQTKGEEQIYQQLLEESKKQQQQIQDDIKTLRDNLRFIQEKMDEMGDDFDPAAFKSLFSNGEQVSVYEYINSTKDDEFSLRWPVSPSRGISAYFRDPSYVKV